MKLPIYLDYNATTPVDPRVLERMLPYFTERFGNASSKAHAHGWMAEEAVNVAREELAELLGAEPEELVFTSGATESISMAIKGAAAARGPGSHIVTAQAEHSAVLETCRSLERQGHRVTYLPVDGGGRVDLAGLEAALTDATALVALQWANNEVGAINPVAEISELLRRRSILFFTDATQAVGKIPVGAARADLLSLSAHKFYGPKGVGALYVGRRSRLRLAPILEGGGQERGLRGGTLNVPGIVGLGAAARLAHELLGEESARLGGLRDRLEARLRSELPELRVNAADGPRLPQTASLTLPGVRAANLIMAARELAFSAGSACSSGTGRPSRVLKAMGLTDDEALSTIRLSLGRFTTDDETAEAARLLVHAAHQVTAGVPT